MLPMDSHFNLPDKLKIDMAVFIQKIGDLPNSDFLKSAGLGGLNVEELCELLHKAFMV